MFSVFHREPRPSPLVDSAVALYGATALILAGSAVGTALGEKAIEVGEKVARKEGEGLRAQAERGRELPELLWEEVSCVLCVCVRVSVCLSVYLQNTVHLNPSIMFTWKVSFICSLSQ